MAAMTRLLWGLSLTFYGASLCSAAGVEASTWDLRRGLIEVQGLRTQPYQASKRLAENLTRALFLTERAKVEDIGSSNGGFLAVPQRPRRLVAAVEGAPEKALGGRRLYQRNATKCDSHAKCGTSEYCMSCKKCEEFHRSLGPDSWDRWTCHPCQGEESVCESAEYCDHAHDAIDGICPTDLAGCAKHEDCGENRYCHNCQGCEGSSDMRCKFCPSVLGGFCGHIRACHSREDAIDNKCPKARGCGAHTDCLLNQYCEGCEACQAIRDSLPEDQRSQWGCAPCDTELGGICEKAIYCHIGEDGIDGTCPSNKACDHNFDCSPSEYCMSCELCQKHHDTLSDEEKEMWTCDPCPTPTGGACAPRQFCSSFEDAFDTVEGCPVFHGCGEHSECAKFEFCFSHDACLSEQESDGEEMCGARSSRGGFCLSQNYCTHGRSIDGKCAQSVPCNTHDQCNSGGSTDAYFCADWEACHQASPDLCGPRSFHADGVCLPVAHCTRGLHTSVTKSCPVSSTSQHSAKIVEVDFVRLNDTLTLNTRRQSMSVWTAPFFQADGDHVIAQLVSVSTASRTNTFLEQGLIGIWSNDTGKNVQLVELSCPTVETAIPASPLHIFEARPHLSEFEMTADHAECSCIAGASSGACPRAAAYALPERGLELDRLCRETPASSYTTPQGMLRYTLFIDNTGLSDCTGSLEVDTDLRFTISPAASGFEGFKVYYFRRDTSEFKTFSCTSNCQRVKLVYDGQSLTCGQGKDASGEPDCLDLHRDSPTPVVPLWVEVQDQTSLQLEQGSICVHCSSVLRRLHPVLFLRRVDLKDELVRTNLTLYSTDVEVRAEAQLVNSTAAGGAGTPSLGCPELGMEDATAPTVESLVSAGKVYPALHVTDKWCVVMMGGCSATAKYNLCVASGAKGVLFMEPEVYGESPDDGVDKSAVIRLAEGETTTPSVPVIYSSFSAKLVEYLSKTDFEGVYKSSSSLLAGENVVKKDPSSGRLIFTAPDGETAAVGSLAGNVVTFLSPEDMAGKKATFHSTHQSMVLKFEDSRVMVRELPEVAIGPWIGRRPRDGTKWSRGGISAYDVKNKVWTSYPKLFRSVDWMEHSPIRSVLFVCTGEGRLLAVDTSTPSQSMEVIGEAQNAPCSRNNYFRDHHIVDVKLGQQYFTAHIPGERGNMINFYDTTSLKEWKFVTQVHANWEHTSSGLGQVKATPDGKRMIVSWHCSTAWCPSNSASQQGGNNVYVLGLESLTRGVAPNLVGIVPVSLTKGSMVRDVACTVEELCLVTLSSDGVAVIDMAQGPSRYQVIAKRSMTVTPVTDGMHHAKAMQGAQRVYASPANPKRFYVEMWKLGQKCAANEGAPTEPAPIGDGFAARPHASATCMQVSGIVAMTLEGYRRIPPADISLSSPPVRAELTLVGGTFEEITSSMPRQSVAMLIEVAGAAIVQAMGVGHERVEVISAAPLRPPEEGALVLFDVTYGIPSAANLLAMLERQLLTENSAFSNGPLRQWSKGARLKILAEAHEDTTGKDAGSDGYATGGFLIVFMAAFMIGIFLTGLILVWAKRLKKAENASLEEARWQSQMQGYPSPQQSPNNAQSFIIGRPADEGIAGGGATAGSAAAGAPGDPSAGTAYVVGRPLSASSGPDAPVYSGSALSSQDAGKLAGGPGASSQPAALSQSWPQPEDQQRSATTSAPARDSPPAAAAAAAAEDESPGSQTLASEAACESIAPAAETTSPHSPAGPESAQAISSARAGSSSPQDPE